MQHNESVNKLIEKKYTCHFCGSKKKIVDHHIIPKCCMGGDFEENLLPVCSSCHQVLENLTRNWIFQGRFDMWHVEYLENIATGKLPITEERKIWLRIFVFVIQTFIPRWEQHKWQTIEEIVKA